ncbi:MAG: AraC family transcriptional regulator [Ruminococcus sp.]
MDAAQYKNYRENKSHTTPDFPYNTYLCSVPLDFPEVPTHWHSEAELIVIKKGCGKVEVDLKAYDACEGDMFLILPGQLHSIGQKENCSMEYENIIFELSLIGSGECDLCGSLLSPLFSGKLSHSAKIDSSIAYYSEAAACIERIDKLCSEKSYGYQLGVKGELFSFFHLIISNHPEAAENKAHERSVEKVKLILSYISENYTRKISTQEAADVCYYSCSHFMKFFKQAMGEGFTQYLNNYRLRIAAQLLISANDSILTVAEKSGFDNLSYFNRSFKKRFGVTPGQYRQGLR